MKNSNVLTTLFVGIDVSSKSNVFCVMNFAQEVLCQGSVPNDRTGASSMAEKLSSLLENSSFKVITIALESTSFYGIHIANYLSTAEVLEVYSACLLPEPKDDCKLSQVFYRYEQNRSP